MKPKGRRAQRREQERELAKFTRDRERLARLEPGGAPDRPIVLGAASEVEVHARGMPCASCGFEVRVLDHSAETVGAARLRVVRVACIACKAERDIYLRLEGAAPN